MKNVVLLVLYNHRFDKNIPKIEKLYSLRFENIFHIIPFYDGEKGNVLSVYECSYFFSGYIAQAKKQLDAKGLFFEHYFIIADDMVLNPSISEYNYRDVFKLTSDSSFLSFFRSLTVGNFYSWPRMLDAYLWNPDQKGTEIKKILPTYDDAYQCFKSHGIELGKWKLRQFVPRTLIELFRCLSSVDNVLKRLIIKKSIQLPNLFLLGRFAEWEYYNMDAAMGAALDFTKNKNFDK